MMQLVKTVSKSVGFSGPVEVQHFPSEKAFTVSNVRNYADFEVVAPSLEYKILEAGPTTYRVEYMPTGMHPVQLKFAGGGEIDRFVVNNFGATLAGIDPALVETVDLTG
eukprot:277694_1